MPEKRKINILTSFAVAAAVILGAWFIIRFVFPWTAPFLFALLTAAFLDPAVNFLQKRLRLPRTVSSVTCSLVFLLSLTGMAAFAAVRLFSEAENFIKTLPQTLSFVPELLSRIELYTGRFLAGAPSETRELLISVGKSFSERIASVPALLSEKLLSKASGIMSGAPKTVLTAVTYILAVFFSTGSYGKIKAFILRQIPESKREKAREIKSTAVKAFEKWLLSYLAIFGITFAELLIAFLMLRIDYAVLLSLFTALVDALPVLGTGTVLIPWAAWSLITGSSTRAIFLAVTYGVITVVRGFIEPKLVGSRAGVSAIAALLALYLGFRCAGVIGMILFPLMLIMLKLFNDCGYLHLWRE